MKVKLTISAIALGAVCMGANVEAKKGAPAAFLAPGGGVEKEKASEAPAPFVSMDFDANGRVSITDVQGMIGWLYLGETPAVCPAAMDFDGNGQVNVTDLMGMMEWMYLGGGGPFYPETVVVKGCNGS